MNGTQLQNLAERLYPICRSITGEGVRETLRILQEYIPLTIQSIPTGTPVFDWTVPEEWTVNEAWLANSRGKRLIDFRDHNLHLLQYSLPFQGRISRAELEGHLHSLPAQPTLIPYKTSYYNDAWGFCLSEEQKTQLVDQEYDVHIDTELTSGVLNYGELLIPGQSNEEFLISTHICHPSLANDNLSGILTALKVALHFLSSPSFYSIRFIFVPGTIGAISWLATNSARLPFIKFGLVLTGLGAGDRFHYKRSESDSSVIDQIAELTLRESGCLFEMLPFSPYGYDERQYNSPGIALSVGCLMRMPHGTYPEYHTSADNLDFIKADLLDGSSDMVIRILQNLCLNRTYRNLLPHCEPQLGKRGIYAADPEKNLAVLWVLNQSNGTRSLLDIALRSKLSFANICDAAQRLLEAGILEKGA